MMKKFSFLLVLVLFFLTTTLTTAQTSNNNSTTTRATCRALINGLEPCTTRSGFFARLATPINSSCCDKIAEIGDTCPRMIRRPWLSRAHRSCRQANPAPSPQPLPPGKKACDYSRLRPCVVEMADYLFSLQNSTITAGCCSTLLDLEGDCGPANYHGALFSKSLDYCHNHH